MINKKLTYIIIFAISALCLTTIALCTIFNSTNMDSSIVGMVVVPAIGGLTVVGAFGHIKSSTANEERKDKNT